MCPDEATFGDRRLEVRRAEHVLDGFDLSQEAVYPPPVVPAEVRTNPAPKIGRFPNVENPVARAAEQVDAARARQLLCEPDLVVRWVPTRRLEAQQVVEVRDAPATGTLEQRMEDVDGRARVVQRAVTRCGARAQRLCQRGDPQ